MSVLITQAEYARSRAARGLPGKSPVAVNQAVRTKRIKLIGRLIDPERADEDWERNSNHRQQRHNRKIAMSVDSNADPQTEAKDGDFLEAQRQREWERVKRERLARLQSERELLLAVEVHHAWSAHIAAVKNSFLLLAPRLAQKLAAVDDVHQCAAVIDAEVRRVLSELANVA